MELNHRRAALQAAALPTELPVRHMELTARVRTRNMLLTRQLLCQLSYVSLNRILCVRINDLTCPLWTGRERG